ncbi:MAG: CoA ester lyase [Alphaproteobacteria bacterium]|nr:CoA ester lyase [Alphaproteobacteria bacterium]
MNDEIHPRRSLLFAPGVNARAIEKARSLSADGIIFDLEDSVAPEMKGQARAAIGAALAQGGYGRRELAVRLNAIDTPYWRDDIAFAARSGVRAIVVPKISGAEDIVAIARAMKAHGAPASLQLWAMIESARGLLNVAQIAAQAAPVTPLSLFILGANDIARETRARMVKGRAPMLSWISQCVLAARAHGLAILDSVYNDIADGDGFRAECEQGRDLGMDGKTVIHPGQIGAANAVFAPPADEIAQARAIAAAFALPENAGKGVIALEGRMVERLHLEMAQRTLAMAHAIEALAAG